MPYACPLPGPRLSTSIPSRRHSPSHARSNGKSNTTRGRPHGRPLCRATRARAAVLPACVAQSVKAIRRALTARHGASTSRRWSLDGVGHLCVWSHCPPAVHTNPRSVCTGPPRSTCCARDVLRRVEFLCDTHPRASSQRLFETIPTPLVGSQIAHGLGRISVASCGMAISRWFVRLPSFWPRRAQGLAASALSLGGALPLGAVLCRPYHQYWHGDYDSQGTVDRLPSFLRARRRTAIRSKANTRY